MNKSFKYKHGEWAPKPPMGWNSWDCFCVTITEQEFLANADYVAKHLKPFGWEYVVLDLAWYADISVDHHSYKNVNIPQNIDEYGRLIPCPHKFPSSINGVGLKFITDYVHSLGLKMGLHIMRGIPVQAVQLKTPVKNTNLTADQISYPKESCPWYNSLNTLDFSKEGAQEYYNSIFELYASWGIDYIKADDVNSWHEVNNTDGSPTGVGSPYRIDDIEGIRNAIDQCGRPMVLSLSPGGPETTLINHLRKNSNLWRISADFWDEWGSLIKQMDRCANWAPFITEGHWPDADMLPLGYMPRGESGGQQRWTNFNHTEQKTLMSVWCMFRSPLMFGGNCIQNDDFTLGLLTNEKVIEINQNSTNNQEILRNQIGGYGLQITKIKSLPILPLLMSLKRICFLIKT
jgi:alpha-galactosidase